MKGPPNRTLAPRPATEPSTLHLVVWGTYDIGKPRVRILMRGLRDNGAKVTECHREVWTGVEDKSQITGFLARLRFAARWLLSYPYLVWRYLRLPRHDAVLLGYLGQLDVLVLWPFARLRRVPIVWDAFLSLYDTVVDDRKLVGPKHPLAFLLYGWEWLACRAADVVMLDTAAHGRYFVDRFRLPPQKVRHVFVGAETDVFHPQPPNEVTYRASRTVLFYGQFIPLHGIETVVRAACLTDESNLDWIIIGRGQEAGKIRQLLDTLSPKRIRWIEWVPYEELLDWIHKADVCLGIFGVSEKAARVIPNKVFQVLAAGKALVTRDSPAIRELLHDGDDNIRLIPPGDPTALAHAVADLTDLAAGRSPQGRTNACYDRLTPRRVGSELLAILTKCATRGPRW